jgi:hypothetical protein
LDDIEMRLIFCLRQLARSCDETCDFSPRELSKESAKLEAQATPEHCITMGWRSKATNTHAQNLSRRFTATVEEVDDKEAPSNNTGVLRSFDIKHQHEYQTSSRWKRTCLHA